MKNGQITLQETKEDFENADKELIVTGKADLPKKVHSFKMFLGSNYDDIEFIIVGDKTINKQRKELYSSVNKDGQAVIKLRWVSSKTEVGQWDNVLSFDLYWDCDSELNGRTVCWRCKLVCKDETSKTDLID